MAESSGDSEREGKTIRVGILTVSDRCFSGQTEDKSGHNLKCLIEEKKLIDGKVCVKEIVPDEVQKIKGLLIDWADNMKLDLILSTGGTGFTARDVTPEATKAVLDRDALGITVAMLTGSLNITPLAMLSRLTCGIRKSTLIINLPGSTKGSEECFRFAAVGVSHAIDQLQGSRESVRSTHSDLQEEGIRSNEPGQIQHTSDESMDNSVESLNPAPDISDPVMDTDFPGTVSFDSLDSTPIIPESTVAAPLPPGSNCQTRTITDETHHAEPLSKGENSQPEEFTQLCFHTDQSNSNLTEEPLTIIAMVPNQSHVPQQSFDKQTKDITELFQLQGSFVDSSDAVLACKAPVLRPESASEIQCSDVPEILTIPELRSQPANRLIRHGVGICDKHGDVYEFNEEAERVRPTLGSVQSNTTNSEEPILRAKLHKSADDGEVTNVDVGLTVKTFLRTHPAIRGIYLNKGKRDVKRNLVKMRRETLAVDVGSWQRGTHIHDRNRLDDHFELTEAGMEKKKRVEKRLSRDEYVVNWYMWCPGHGNCRRSCGGYGKCVNGCKGKTHKQDRHNCRLLVNLKMFLSDTAKWRVHISGSHVPLESNILWEPPKQNQQRINEDTRDVILATVATKKTSSSQIQEVLSKKPVAVDLPVVPSKRKICRFVSSMKKRRKQRNYNCRDNSLDGFESVKDDGEDGSGGEGAECVDIEGEEFEGDQDGEEVINVDEDDDDDDEEEEDKDNVESSSMPCVPAFKGFQAVSDAVGLDESNMVPSLTCFKMTDPAGNVYLSYTRNVPANENTSSAILTNQSVSGNPSVAHNDMVLQISSSSAQTGYIYAPSGEGVDMSGPDQSSSDQDVAGCSDLGALFLATFKPQ
ncbi:uncharacterized protein [Haliotis cracherodii]|uniref:uncharacterized protein isoform X1 n=1 Tax=Haliotis cracherodii TaxID=6455 RepID=UPI0039EA1018